MSHWTKVKTKLTNQEVIGKALERMGYTCQFGNFTITEYGTSEKAEILLDSSLGLSLQEDGTYAFVGDPYHCRTQKLSKWYRKLDQFQQKLSVAYTLEEAKEVLEAQQFFIDDDEVDLNGEGDWVEITFTRNA